MTGGPWAAVTGYGSDSGGSNFNKTYDALSGSYTENVEIPNQGDGTTTPYYKVSGTAGEKGYVDQGSSSCSAKLTLPLGGTWTASGSGTDDRVQTFDTYYSGKGSGSGGSGDTAWSTNASDSGTSQSVTKRHADLSPKASTDGSVAWSESAVVNSSDVTSDNRFSDDNTWGGATATFDPGQGPCGCSHADQYLHQEVEVVDALPRPARPTATGTRTAGSVALAAAMIIPPPTILGRCRRESRTRCRAPGPA